jgi:hypothetical protein
MRESRTSTRSLLLSSHLTDIFFINNEYRIDPFPYSGLITRKIGDQTFVFGRKKEFEKNETKNTPEHLLFIMDKAKPTREELITEVVNHGWVDLIGENLLPFNLSGRKVEIFKKIVGTFNRKLKISLEDAKNDHEPIYEFGGEEEVKRLLFNFRHEAAIASGLNTSHTRFSDMDENPCSVKLQWRQNVKAYLKDPLKRNHYFLRAEWDWLNDPNDQPRSGYGVNQCCGPL